MGGEGVGGVVLFDALSLQTVNIVRAHKGPLAALALNDSGNFLATGMCVSSAPLHTPTEWLGSVGAWHRCASLFAARRQDAVRVPPRRLRGQHPVSGLCARRAVSLRCIRYWQVIVSFIKKKN